MKLLQASYNASSSPVLLCMQKPNFSSLQKPALVRWPMASSPQKRLLPCLLNSSAFSSSANPRPPCSSLQPPPPPPVVALHSLPSNWTRALSLATSLYPLYVFLGASLAFFYPSSFSWFVSRGPSSYSFALASIMLATGLSLRLEDLLEVILKRPLQLFYGCAAQYVIMPLLGAAISRALCLPTSLSAGLILLACCPGGTASNVVTYIARGDVPLSVVMTVCTTFASVCATPLLTQFFAGSYVPVNAAGLAISTLQVVLAPVVFGAWLQSTFPMAVARIVPFSPVAAVLISSLLACSVFSANVGLLGNFAEMTSISTSSMVIVAQAVLILHAAGFLLGYLAAMLLALQESQRRAISIEVGMQNSSLGVVLATMHFSSPLVAVPAAVSAVIMNVMGSGLAVVWRHSGHEDLLQEGAIENTGQDPS